MPPPVCAGSGRCTHLADEKPCAPQTMWRRFVLTIAKRLDLLTRWLRAEYQNSAGGGWQRIRLGWAAPVTKTNPRPALSQGGAFYDLTPRGALSVRF